MISDGGQVFLDGRVTLHAGDCLAVIKTLPDNSIDACVTDPPYALVSIGKRFSADNAAPCKLGKTGAYARASAGFMGKKWDTGETAFAVEFWREIFRVLKPGAHVVAFGGTRSYHRLACAIEDAGFEIRDQIKFDHDSEGEAIAFLDSLTDEQQAQFVKLCERDGTGQLAWAYGSGFPKSHDVSKGIDKSAGHWRGRAGAITIAEQPAKGTEYERTDKGSPVTAAAAAWEGWGTALKPAWEPICLARKPLSEKSVAANVLRWGTGAINVDACRVPTGDALGGGDQNPATKTKTEGWDRPWMQDESLKAAHAARVDANVEKAESLGRWPANLVHDGSAEVLAAFPDVHSAGAARGEPGGGDGWGNIGKGVKGFRVGDDSGSAARFFASFPQQNVARCGLCGLLYGDASTTTSLCNANNAEANSSIESTQIGAFAPCGAAGSPSPEGAGKNNPSIDRASTAANPSAGCHPPSDGSVLRGAPPLLLSEVAQNVRSAASLCGSCATDIAQNLVEVRQSGSAAELHFKNSIAAFKEIILSRSLASYVERRESTDTILTTINLKQLFGSVFHAIDDYINSERSVPSIKSGSKRLWYSAKADKDDRLGSKHPTVKPVDLMQWLCRLVCPPGGQILDPFAGTGTTGEAAWREGFNAVLIEREAEYQGDIARRMSLCLSGPATRSAESAKARYADKPVDNGPLFGGTGLAGGADRFTADSQTKNRTDRA